MKRIQDYIDLIRKEAESKIKQISKQQQEKVQRCPITKQANKIVQMGFMINGIVIMLLMTVQLMILDG